MTMGHIWLRGFRRLTGCTVLPAGLVGGTVKGPPSKVKLAHSPDGLLWRESLVSQQKKRRSSSIDELSVISMQGGMTLTYDPTTALQNGYVFCPPCAFTSLSKYFSRGTSPSSEAPHVALWGTGDVSAISKSLYKPLTLSL